LLHFESFIILFYLFLGYLRKVVTDCDEENKIKNFYIRDRDLSSLESMNLFLHSICITANILFLDHQRWSMMGLLKVYELTHRRIMTFILKLIYVNLYIKHTLDNKNSIHFFFFNLRMVLFSLHHLLIISTSIILNTFFYWNFHFNFIPQYFVVWEFSFMIFFGFAFYGVIPTLGPNARVWKVSLGWFRFFRSFYTINCFYNFIIQY
jgi:hypothetical protein